MEAQKLTVANPTVQHTIDVNVVGLQEKVRTNKLQEESIVIHFCRNKDQPVRIK